MSLLRGAELENGRAVAHERSTVLLFCTPNLCDCQMHVVGLVISIRDDMAVIELGDDVNVRRAATWRGERSAGAALRLFAAPAMQLGAGDISIAQSERVTKGR